ncbi:hypothetical protein D9M69_595040 [compost metagenome]
MHDKEAAFERPSGVSRYTGLRHFLCHCAMVKAPVISNDSEEMFQAFFGELRMQKVIP